MKNIKKFVTQLSKNIKESVIQFPASIISAFLILVIASIRIAIGYQLSSDYGLILNSLQLALLLSAASGQALTVFAKNKEDKKYFKVVNIACFAIFLIAFGLLYFTATYSETFNREVLSVLSIARVVSLTIVSLILFVLFLSKNKKIQNFYNSFYLTNKALAISILYGSVLMIGISSVLGVFQALIYNDLSFEVFQYAAVVIIFISYTLFLAQFSSFKKDNEKIEQPAFFKNLLDYVLLPIFTALTVILLIWSARVLFSGLDVTFLQLSTILTSYTIFGLWLYLMLAVHKNKLFEFYKLFFPISAILVLIFKGWALVSRIIDYSVGVSEYSFALIWIFSILSVVLLLIKQSKSFERIAIAAITIAIIWVLPFIGYQDFTYTMQVRHLENILEEENMLVDNKIKSSKENLAKLKKLQISKAVDQIDNSGKKARPEWFKDNLSDYQVFLDTFGFEKRLYEDVEQPPSMYSSYTLDNAIIDISDYSKALVTRGDNYEFTINNNDYNLNIINQRNLIPKIIVKENQEKIIETDLEKTINNLKEKYPFEDNNSNVQVNIEDMSLTLKSDNLEILIVFEMIDNIQDSNNDDYFLQIFGIYIK